MRTNTFKTETLERRICLSTSFLSFSPPINSAVGSAPVIATGDFTNDKKVDLVARASDGIVRLFKGNGDGTFDTNGAVIPAGFGVTSIVVSDFDKDGNLDLACANNPGLTAIVSSVTILLGHGDGTFTKSSAPYPGANPDSLAVADVDRDGLPDLISGNEVQWSPPGTLQPATYGAGILRGRGDGTFDAVTKINLAAPQKFVAAGDVNGDGASELAFVGPNVASASPLPQSILFASLNNGSGGFQTGGVSSFPGGSAGLLMRDLNGDTRADIALVQVFPHSNTGGTVPGDATVKTFLYAASPTPTNAGPFKGGASIAIPETQAAGISAADFDGDGRADLAVAGTDARPSPTANAPGGIVVVIPGRPLAASNAQPIFRTGPAPLAQAVDDLNGDKKPDIVTGHANGVNTLLNTSHPLRLGDTTDGAMSLGDTAADALLDVGADA